jgi:hypothetical protein
MKKISTEWRNALQEDVNKLMRYREALGQEDKQVLDKLVSLAKNHASACANANKMNLLESMLLAIVIEQQKTIERLSVSNSGSVAILAGTETNPGGEGRQLPSPPGNQKPETYRFFFTPTLQVLPGVV